MANQKAAEYLRGMANEMTRFGARVAYQAKNHEMRPEDYQELGRHEGKLKGFLDALLMLDEETARDVVPIVERMMRDLGAIQPAIPTPADEGTAG